MAWIAPVVVGAVSALSSLSAGSSQKKAAKLAAAESRRRFNETRLDLSPYREAGTMALSELRGRLPELLQPFGREQFEESPAYQFNLEQGQKAIEKAAAARGRYYAPATLQDIGRFSQGLASNEFQNAFGNYQTNMDNIWNRLYGLSETGRGAAIGTGELGARATSERGGFLTDAAAASAAGKVGAANALTGAYSDYQNLAMLEQILARQQQSSYGGGSAYTGNAAPF